MANRKEHSIDRLFRKKLHSHEEKTPEYSWSVISEELDRQRKVRYLRITKYAAAVIAILLAFYTGYEFSGSRFTDEQMTQTEKETTTPITQEPAAIDQTNLTAMSSFNNVNLALKEHPASVSKRKSQYEIFRAYSAPDRRQTTLTSLNSYRSEQIENVPFGELTFPGRYWEKMLQSNDSRVLALSNDIKVNKPDLNNNSQNQWTLGGSFAPTYSYRTTNNDKLDFFNNSFQTSKNNPGSYEKALISYSTGINAQYAVNETWQFETGLYYSRFGHKKEALLVSNKELEKGGEYYLNTSAGKVNSSGIPENVSAEIRLSFSPGNNSEEFIANTSEDARLYQKFDYVEVPMKVKYKVYNQKIGINLISGLSTGLLVNNETIIQTTNKKRNLGYTENIREVLHSTLLGLGFHLPLSEKLIIDFEPTFKYGLHSINSSDEFGYKPYSLGIYSGIQYQF